jgi:hypothetical protein
MVSSGCPDFRAMLLDGLAGDVFPIVGKIASLDDFIDAMIARRYRPEFLRLPMLLAGGHDRAREYIAAWEGRSAHSRMSIDPRTCSLFRRSVNLTSSGPAYRRALQTKDLARFIEHAPDRRTRPCPRFETRQARPPDWLERMHCPTDVNGAREMMRRHRDAAPDQDRSIFQPGRLANGRRRRSELNVTLRRSTRRHPEVLDAPLARRASKGARRVSRTDDRRNSL